MIMIRDVLGFLSPLANILDGGTVTTLERQAKGATKKFSRDPSKHTINQALDLVEELHSSTHARLPKVPLHILITQLRTFIGNFQRYFLCVTPYVKLHAPENQNTEVVEDWFAWMTEAKDLVDRLEAEGESAPAAAVLTDPAGTIDAINGLLDQLQEMEVPRHNRFIQCAIGRLQQLEQTALAQLRETNYQLSADEQIELQPWQECFAKHGVELPPHPYQQHVLLTLLRKAELSPEHLASVNLIDDESRDLDPPEAHQRVHTHLVSWLNVTYALHEAHRLTPSGEKPIPSFEETYSTLSDLARLIKVHPAIRGRFRLANTGFWQNHDVTDIGALCNLAVSYEQYLADYRSTTETLDDDHSDDVDTESPSTPETPPPLVTAGLRTKLGEYCYRQTLDKFDFTEEKQPQNATQACAWLSQAAHTIHNKEQLVQRYRTALQEGRYDSALRELVNYLDNSAGLLSRQRGQVTNLREICCELRMGYTSPTNFEQKLQRYRSEETALETNQHQSDDGDHAVIEPRKPDCSTAYTLVADVLQLFKELPAESYQATMTGETGGESARRDTTHRSLLRRARGFATLLTRRPPTGHRDHLMAGHKVDGHHAHETASSYQPPVMVDATENGGDGGGKLPPGGEETASSTSSSDNGRGMTVT